MKSALHLIAVLALLVIFQKGHSKTFLVSQTTDPQLRVLVEGTLRWAVAQAEKNPGRDTIIFDQALTDSTIVLNNEIQISDALVIKGIGIGGITIDCQEITRAFWVVPANDKNRYEFSGVTLLNAVVPSNSNYPNGGAILCDNLQTTNHLTIKRCVFSNCKAFSGGAISYTGSAISIDSCLFSNNQITSNGGALHLYISEGSAEINHSHFEYNQIDYMSQYGQGGAINISQYASTTLIENSSFLRNSAISSGGAVSYSTEFNEPLVVANCSFIGNYAYKYVDGVFNGEGGAIAVSASTLEMYHSTLVRNTSGKGAAVAIQGASILTQNSIYYNNYNYSTGNQLRSKDITVTRGKIQSLGGNFVQDTIGWKTVYQAGEKDVLNYDAANSNLFYGETNFNSFTYYIPPRENSPIIGGAVSSEYITDQLGNKRGKPADIGAVETSYYIPPRAYAGEDDTVYTDHYVLQAAEEPQSDYSYWEILGDQQEIEQSPNAIITELQYPNTYVLVWHVLLEEDLELTDTVRITVLNAIPEITATKIVIKQKSIEEELDLKTVVKPYKAIDSLWVRGPFAVLKESDLTYEVDYENFILKLTVLNDSIQEFQDSLLLGVCNGFGSCDSASFSIAREGVVPVSGVKAIKVFNFISSNSDCKNEVFDFQIQTTTNELLSFLNPETPCSLSESSDYDNLFGRIKNIEVIIFNRWGDQVALIDSYFKPITNVWIPTELPDGTYYYKIVLDLGNGEFKKSGFLELR